MEALLSTLSADPEREGTPIGELPEGDVPSWAHITLYPVGYDRLEMSGDAAAGPPEPTRATQLWLGLAQAAMATDGALDPNDPPDAATVAETLRQHRPEGAYDQAIVGYLLQLADELRNSSDGESEAIRRRMSQLIQDLDQPTLRRMVEMGGDATQRQRFVMDTNQTLAVDAVMKVLQAAADASEQTISTSLARMLTKLAAHAEEGTQRIREGADGALRENVSELIEDWELGDPNPDEYTLILDHLSRTAPLFAAQSEDVEELPGPARLIQTSLEVDAYGPTVQKAFQDLVEKGQIVWLMEILDEAPEGSETAQRLRNQLDTPAQLRRLLTGDDVDEDVLRVIVQRVGEESIEPLVEALTDSESRAIRRKVFDCLAEMPGQVRDRAIGLLEDERWYVLRNALALLQLVGPLPEDVLVGPLLTHEDVRVRREAFPLVIRSSKHRDRAVAQGLVDSDERMVRMALMELQDRVAETLVPTIVSRVIDAAEMSELRTLAVRALRGARSSLALDALISLCTRGKTLFGRPKLAKRSPEMLEALSVLADRWSDDSAAKRVLGRARKSKDPVIRQAVKGLETS